MSPEVRCRKCGKVLKNPTSVRLGVGPLCVKKIKFVEQLELFPRKEEIVEAKSK